MDSLFKEYGNPTFLLDGLISSCQFSAWVDAQQENKDENIMWEMWLHKLGAWDERSFDEFRHDITRGRNLQNVERPSDEQLTATVRKSFEIFKDFEIPQEGG